MGFFYAQEKKDKPAKRPQAISRGTISIETIQRMGCDVCPRKRDWPDLRAPQMTPEGSASPEVYILGPAPGDADRGPFENEVGAHLQKKLRKVRGIRWGNITQCAPRNENDFGMPAAEELALESCRGRVIADIEQAKPVVVIGVGDQALRWAVPLDTGTAMTFRGRMFVARFGSHVCWFYSIIWPNYLVRESKHPSEYEITMTHDLRRLTDALESGDLDHLARFDHTKGPYDTGIEYITGQDAGDMVRLEKSLDRLALLPRTALDWETNGLRPCKLKEPMLLTAAIGTFDHTVAFSIAHPDGWGTKGRVDRVMQMVGEFLLYSGRKIAHNLAFEQEWAAEIWGAWLLRRTSWGDTMAMAHTLDERPGTKSLEVQTVTRYGFNLKRQSPVDPSRPNWWTLYSLREILRYNGMDTKWTDRLFDDFMADLLAGPPALLQEYHRKVDLAPTLVLTQMKGLPVDLDFAEDLARDFKGKIRDVKIQIAATPEVKAFERRFGGYDPGNPRQTLKLLKDICERPEVIKSTRDGDKESSDEEVLNSLPADEVPSAPLTLELRGLEKQLSTYILPVLNGEVTALDGMIHAQYSSMVAETGRLNAFDPNVQNWPKRKFRIVRGIIVAGKRYWILACDYGQIEFRVAAMASEDENLVRACWTDWDVHVFWAERLVAIYPPCKDYIVSEFGVDWDEKGLKTLRQEMKNGWVFPQIFGSSVKSCAANLHIPLDVADDLAVEFWDFIPGVKKWQDRILDKYARTGYVETLTGSRRRGPLTKNQIINVPIQGTAAHIVTAGMTALSEMADLLDDPDYQPNLNVHDDLSTIIHDRNLEAKIPVIAREMCRHRFDFINVPLVVEVSVGERWDRVEEIAKFRSDQLFNLPNPYAKEKA